LIPVSKSDTKINYLEAGIKKMAVGQARNQPNDTKMPVQTSAGITFCLMITQSAQDLPLFGLGSKEFDTESLRCAAG
jgi:hypothetical protein